jgi:hypothetical protein
MSETDNGIVRGDGYAVAQLGGLGEGYGFRKGLGAYLEGRNRSGR